MKQVVRGIGAIAVFVTGFIFGSGPALADNRDVVASAALTAYAGHARPHEADEQPAHADDWAILPRILSSSDRVRYKKIFVLQDLGRFQSADRLIRELEDDLLLGHVMYQRYMHPRAYRSKYKELYEWLKEFADHPGASEVYKLAIKRRPKNWKWPKRPITGYLSGAGAGDGISYTKPYRSKMKRSKAVRKNVRYLKHVIRRQVRRGRPSIAEKVLNRKDTRTQFDAVEYDTYRGRVARAFLFSNKPDRAFKLAAAAAKRSRRWVPEADWTAGLAAWQLQRWNESARHFEAYLASKRLSGWNVAASAFWAARANMRLGNSERAVELWQRAAGYSRTFYGLLAARMLGREPDYRWQVPELEQAGVDGLTGDPAIRRAMALVEVDRHRLAERELRKTFPRFNQDQRDTLLALAERLHLPALALRMGVHSRDKEGRVLDFALYPLPKWQPQGGYTIDRALLFGLMRQESGFKTNAKSRVGARGLMQLMPRTASFIARDRSLVRRNRDLLFSPEYNIELAQKYLQHLLENNEVAGNLLYMAVAYNGGPGNLVKWLKRTGRPQDPLVFIELIPALETRLFVERVFANFWTYRKRLEQATPSLDAVATGDWPYYQSLDEHSMRLASNGGN